MKPITNPVVPSKETDRWLYETLRNLQIGMASQAKQFAAIDRGEAPSLGGSSLAGVLSHRKLQDLVPWDDHTQYALLRGVLVVKLYLVVLLAQVCSLSLILELTS